MKSLATNFNWFWKDTDTVFILISFADSLREQAYWFFTGIQLISMQKSSLIREIQETDLQSQSCFTEQSLLHLSNVTKGSCGAEAVYPSCSTVEVKGGYSELCTIPSLRETQFWGTSTLMNFQELMQYFLLKMWRTMDNVCLWKERWIDNGANLDSVQRSVSNICGELRQEITSHVS